MIVHSIVALALTTAIATSPMPQVETDNWTNIGDYRVTTYDIHCNDPQGRESSSGVELEYGYVAMNGVPFGTKIAIEGEVFEVVDRVGVDNTVDIFVENDSGYCKCNKLEYKTVYMEQKHE